MHIIFVNYEGSRSNSAVHIFHLANELVRRRTRCTVCVPGAGDDFGEIGVALFDVVAFADVSSLPSPGPGPCLVHAWTPREAVRKVATRIAERLRCPYVVHLEDNEELLLSESLGISIEQVRRMSEAEADRRVPQHLAHPYRARRFINDSVGLSCVVERLLELKPDGKAGVVIWPGYDPDRNWLAERDEGLARKLGIASGESALVYTGNVHAANTREVASLYLAVAVLNRRGLPAKLIRTGTDYRPLLERETEGAIRPFVRELGRVPRDDLPMLLGLADVLVQPGRPDAFNDYRFPSKVPEFLASGRPVVLPKANIGLALGDGVQCMLLQHGWATEIADKVELLLRDPTLAQTIGRNGKAFAEENLSWSQAATRVEGLYQEVLRGRGG